jgi:hypothetical protein
MLRMHRILASSRPLATQKGIRSFALAVKYAANGPASEVYKCVSCISYISYWHTTSLIQILTHPTHTFIFRRLVTADPIGALGATEVALKFIAAPINPSDINLVSRMN